VAIVLPTRTVWVRWDGATWTDESAHCSDVSWERGSAGEFGSAEAGTFTVNLLNGADRFMPLNPASPMYGQEVQGAEVLAIATYSGTPYPIAAGYIRTARPVGSYAPAERMVALVCDDALGAWSRNEVTLPAALYGQEAYDVRGLVLDGMGVAAGQRSIAHEPHMLVYGDHVVILDAAGNVVSEFDSGWTASPSAILEAVNQATLGRHWVKPGTTTATPWVYTSVDRNHNVEAAGSLLTYGTDYDELEGLLVEDNALGRVTMTPHQWDGEAPTQAVAGPGGGNVLSLSSPLVPSLAEAQGVADHMYWRFSAPRLRPALVLQNRWPASLQRDLFDVVTVTDPRYYLTTRRFEVVGIAGTWGPGAFMEVRWRLQEAPLQAAASLMSWGDTINSLPMGY
jgi:hypothetical protein